MARETTVAWAAFPTRDEAEQAIERLRSSGFSRNSIDLDRRRDGSWNVAVHTSARNLHRVEDLLHASAPMYALRERTFGAFEAMDATLLCSQALPCSPGWSRSACRRGTVVCKPCVGSRVACERPWRTFPKPCVRRRGRCKSRSPIFPVPFARP